MNRDPQPSDFVSGLTEAARANPLAAALIGGGALWLLVGNQRLKDMAGAMIGAAQALPDVDGRSVRTRAVPLSEKARDTGDAIAEHSSSAVQGIRDGVSSAVDTMKDGITDTVGQASDMVRAVPNPIPSIKQGYGQAQSALSDLLDKQPLVLGAVGVAIGAAVAGAFPLTTVENQWAGPSSDNLKTEVQARATAVSEKARGSVGRLVSEVRGVAEDTAERVQRAGHDAVAAALQKPGAT